MESSLEVKGELDDEAATVHEEFEEEAVRLVGTSGRTQREIAEDLGVGLSTLVRWISRSRDRLAEIPDKAPQADMAAELKRLRRENEILRQERDISKRATAFSPGRD
ncbi:transposase [Sphingomonas sp. Leaf231]|uniref:transposase n=1 Tax=Sphingomonas sp. Leaf231 TaxID=1736301 RepID=UPI002E0FB0A4